jgi:hypothetical protein
MLGPIVISLNTSRDLPSVSVSQTKYLPSVQTHPLGYTDDGVHQVVVLKLALAAGFWFGKIEVLETAMCKCFVGVWTLTDGLVCNLAGVLKVL